MIFTLPPLIYNRIDTILDVFDRANGDATYGYFKTKQRGFAPINDDLLHPSQFPWMFLEFGNTTAPAYPVTNNMEYDFILNLVAMTVADKGKIGDLVVSESLNVNKGILDILKDVGAVLGAHKVGGLGIAGVIDWHWGSTRPMANMMYMTPQNLSPYIRIIQIDLIFQCRERIVP